MFRRLYVTYATIMISAHDDQKFGWLQSARNGKQTTLRLINELCIT